MGISATGGRELKTVVDQAKDIVELMLSKVLIPGLPFYIAGVFAEMAVDGTVFSTLKTFGVVLMLAIVMHWIWLSVLYFSTGAVTGRNPLTMLRNMIPAYLTAVGTMSSAATIPVTVRQAKANGIDENVVDFAVPLCATIHLSGSAITLTTCATAVMLLTGLAEPTYGMTPAVSADAGCYPDRCTGCTGWCSYGITGSIDPPCWASVSPPLR